MPAAPGIVCEIVHDDPGILARALASDDELLGFLAEARRPAGLARIDGQLLLIEEPVEPVLEPVPEPPPPPPEPGVEEAPMFGPELPPGFTSPAGTTSPASSTGTKPPKTSKSESGSKPEKSDSASKPEKTGG